MEDVRLYKFGIIVSKEYIPNWSIIESNVFGGTFRDNIIISIAFVDNVTSRYDVIIIVRHYRNYAVKRRQRKNGGSK